MLLVLQVGHELQADGESVAVAACSEGRTKDGRDDGGYAGATPKDNRLHESVSLFTRVLPVIDQSSLTVRSVASVSAISRCSALVKSASVSSFGSPVTHLVSRACGLRHKLSKSGNTS